MKYVLSFCLGAVLTFLLTSYAYRPHPAPPVQAKLIQDRRPFDPKVDVHAIQTAKKYDFSNPSNFPLADSPCPDAQNKKSK
jgi:hypothetical protein